MPGNILAVVGGQYGSEGKGVIVHSIANEYGIHVRTGGPNAGHSFKHAGRTWKQQVIPCGWTNPNALLVIGRGALVDVAQLKKELDAIREVDPTIDDRLIIDEKAGTISPQHHAEEGGVHGEIHRRIGSTGEGVGAARIARIQRDSSKFQPIGSSVSTFGPWVGAGDGWLQRLLVRNTPGLLYRKREGGVPILLEGTQGSGLSLIHGPWPYVTSNDTNAAQLAADAGIAPRFVNRTLLVCRTFPIRVAGNSGPLEGETTWDELSRLTGRPVLERTTVTNKIRRVGNWDLQKVLDAIVLNAPTSLAITFMDYLFPQTEGVEDHWKLTKSVEDWVDVIEAQTGVEVSILGTGGPTWSTIRRRALL